MSQDNDSPKEAHVEQETVSSQSQEELQAQLDDIQSQIDDKKSNFSHASKEKQAAYRSLKSVKDKVRSRYSRIKELKEQRDGFTKQVKELKEKRGELHKQVKEHGSTLRQTGGPAQKGRYVKRVSPAALRKQIESLEFKLETEAMQFKKEQQVRKTIKELQSQLAGLEVQQEAKAVAASTRKEFSEAKQSAEETHKAIQDLAEKSQEKHQKLQEILSEVKQFRKEEKAATQEYMQKKEAFDVLKQEMDALTAQAKELKEQLGIHDTQSLKARAKEKAAQAREKMKRGGKLSTEDILALQAE